jgi:hypothetical protein
VPDPVQVTRRARELHLECACIVGNRSVNPKGMGLCNPDERAGFLAEIKASLEAAKRFETTRLVVLTGFKQREAAAKYFRKALEIQPDIKMTKSLANPEIQAAFDEVAASIKSGTAHCCATLAQKVAQASALALRPWCTCTGRNGKSERVSKITKKSGTNHLPAYKVSS